MTNKFQNIPVIGNYYYFFDDGKTSPSRCYKAKVTRIIPYDKCNLEFEIYDYDCDCKIKKTLKEIHKEEVDYHRQSDNFTVLNGSDIKSGKPWLYAEETDYFIECEIPGYDEHKIWFARDIHGGWFSMDVESSWQSGELDVDGSKYKEVKNWFDEVKWFGWYDEELRKKKVLI